MAKKTIIDEIAIANGKYEFPNELADELISRQKSIMRRVTNAINYGDEGGSTSMKRQRNSTQDELPTLQKKTDEARLLYACFMACEDAPVHLRKYLFENMKIWLCKHGRSITTKCSHWTASILPAVWTQGWENENIHRWDTEAQLQKLLPASGLEIGTKVLVPAYGKELIEGTIIGYTYQIDEEIRLPYNRYGRSGRYAIHYDVKYGAASYSHSPFKMKAIKFPSAVAV